MPHNQGLIKNIMNEKFNIGTFGFVNLSVAYVYEKSPRILWFLIVFMAQAFVIRCAAKHTKYTARYIWCA